MPARHSTPPARPARGGIAVVGPCAAGKSSLVAALRERGFDARQVAQEHSYVPDMWQRISQPEFLIFLDASFETCTRRKQLDWVPREYQEQQNRLRHAREHCDVYLATDALSPPEVVAQALQALGGRPPGA